MNILRYEQDSVEFFTVEATGESGMSQSGLARLCGVKPHAVNQLLNSVITSSCPDFLKPLQGKDLALITSVNEFKGVTIIKDTVCALILEWYAFESQRTTDKARQSFRQFAKIGIRTWIQGITGWSNPAISQPQPSIVQPLGIAELLHQLEGLKHDVLVALKHRHAIHNIVEQPTVVDLSLSRIVHTAVHEQCHKLNGALTKLDSLQQMILAFQFFAQTLSEASVTGMAFGEFSESVEQLRQENRSLKVIVEEQNAKIVALAKSLGNQLNLRNDAERQSILGYFVEERIQQITAKLLENQPEKGRKRSLRAARRRATLMARFEFGEPLKDVADDLKIPYSSAKTFVRLVRLALNERD